MQWLACQLDALIHATNLLYLESGEGTVLDS
jgi:hypothetical protein